MNGMLYQLGYVVPVLVVLDVSLATVVEEDLQPHRFQSIALSIYEEDLNNSRRQKLSEFC